MRDRKRGDAPFIILKYLGDHGPASYEKIASYLKLPQSTVEYGIREILMKRHGLVKKLDNDKFALKWHSAEEQTVKSLKAKLLRNPRPEELAGLMRKPPSEARELLIRFIPGYREPTDDEIACSAKCLWSTIVAGLDLPKNRYWFEQGVTKLITEGIDKETLKKLLEIKTAAMNDESNRYLIEFPEMKPSISTKKESNWATIKLEWSEEAKRSLYPIDLWNQIAEIKIPRKYDGRAIYGSSAWDSIDIAEELAEIYVPTPEIFDSLINFVGLAHYEVKVLTILKKFCENALVVDQLNEETKKMIVLSLLNVAFVKDRFKHERNYEQESDAFEERNKAFEIIQLLDVRCDAVIDAAKDYIIGYTSDDPLNNNFVGPNIHHLVDWLAKDQRIRSELIDEVEELLAEADTTQEASFFQDLLNRLLNHIPSCGICAR